MSRSRNLFGLVVFGLLAGLAIGTLAWAAAHPERSGERATGVTLDAGPGGEAEAFEEFLGAGANAIEAPQAWNELEPARGRYRLGDVASIVSGLRSTAGMRIMLIPAAIETSRRSVPSYLGHERWDGRAMIGGYRRLLRRLAPHLSRQVRYVSIANEADVYFSAHPRELPAFLRFARAEIAEVRRLVPGAKVGVTVTYAGLTAAHPLIARTLARLGDATIVTYYPLVDGYRMRAPRAPLRDLPRMVRIAAGRPLVIQEAGYSSSPRLGGSPERQATFVRSVFKARERVLRAIPFLSFYTLFDPPASQCRGNSDAVAFLCSLGLHYRSGKPKPAWAAFEAGIRAGR